MANLNKVFLIGNLTRDPELRYIPSGTAVATFTLASGRVYKTASGEKREETCFVRVVSWARQAELVGEYLTKGSPCFVEGRLASRSWETPDGQKRSMIEVVAQNIQFLGRARSGGGGGEGYQSAAPDAGDQQAPGPEGDLPPDGGDSGGEEESREVPF
ncbi:MAG: single-stranded DNA-binding protein [Candidatus Omnitrophica bacterium CG11_big_fil_rev_8_21_14_0_20_64_10]|nr:MAG: single-stranded DNA-binding protein [Candidatus Omnitrophica bacterium CG11_big_fil_rev_8_21_14_0_20_64_10]